jgi:integrase
MAKRRYERRGNLYSTRYYDPVTKKRRRVSRQTPEAVDDFLAEIRRQAREGTYVDPDLGRKPFPVFADEFLAGLSHLSPGGYRNVEASIRLHIKPHFEGSVATIAPAHVRAWVKLLRDDRGLAPSTIQKHYQAFQRMMSVAVLDGYRAKSPCVDIKLPRNEAVTEEHVYLTARQVLRLADEIDPRYSSLVILGAWGGLRISEMIALHVEDCRLDGPQPHVIVRASMEDLGSRQRRKTTKTDKVRRVNLPPQVAARLKAHIAHFPPVVTDSSGRCTAPRCEGYVFMSARRCPLARRNFTNRHFKPAVKAAGLPERTRVHDLRHTCAALLISNGESLSVVADHLGHSTERTTERYKHLLPTANERAVAKLAAEFERASQPAA